MKKCLLLAALWIGVIGLMPLEAARAAKIKIGLIDTQKIMRESKAAKKTRTVFLQERDTKRAVLKAKQDVIRAMDEELKRKGKDMSASVRKEKAEKLAREIKELRRLRSDLEEELKKRDVELTRKLLREIKEIVQQFSKKGKYTVILEKKSVVAADEKIDITDKIIRLYDALKK